MFSLIQLVPSNRIRFVELLPWLYMLDCNVLVIGTFHSAYLANDFPTLQFFLLLSYS